MAKITKEAEGTSDLTDRQLILIGRVATGFALVEFVAHGIASALVTNIQALGRIAVSGGRFPDLLTKINELAKYRGMSPEVRESISSWTGAAGQAHVDRNRVLHTPWFVEPSRQSLLGFRMGRRAAADLRPERISDERLATISDAVWETAGRGFELLGAVVRLE